MAFSSRGSDNSRSQLPGIDLIDPENPDISFGIDDPGSGGFCRVAELEREQKKMPILLPPKLYKKQNLPFIFSRW